MDSNQILEKFPELKFDKKRNRVKFCPCGRDNKDGKFVPYVGFENKGYCHSCGETFLPELPNDEQINLQQFKSYKPKPFTQQPKPVSFIPVEIFKQTLQIGKNITLVAEKNHFIKFLISLFGEEVTNELVNSYFIGTSKHWQGACIFWQVESEDKVRTGKIMLYNPITGKRVKEPFNYINWAHKLIKKPEYCLKQCFFGEHLLNINGNENKPVALVESEKTALIANVYFEQLLGKDKNFIWLAFGGIGFNIDRCHVLKGRNVTLFPDLSKPKEGELTAFEKWSNKAKELSRLASFNISDFLERKATEKEKKQGLDLADYLIRFNYKDFNIEPSKPTMDIEILPELQPIEDNDNLQNRTNPAYVSETGELYIETPNWTTYTIYPSVDHYNNRLCLPDFIDKDKISIDGFKVVQINLDLLKIIKAD